MIAVTDIQRELMIGPAVGESFEIGARLFAALAFPAPDEDSSRSDAELAYVASYLHEANRIDDTDEPFKDPRLNAMASHSPRWVRQKLRTTLRRLEDRNEVAKAVRPWASELIGLGPHRAVPGIKKFTMRQIALHLCNGDIDRADRFQKRVWRPCRPVMHLAIAIDEKLCAMNLPDHRLGVDLANVDFFRSIIERAAWLQPRIAVDPHFGIDARNQLTLTWVE